MTRSIIREVVQEWATTSQSVSLPVNDTTDFLEEDPETRIEMAIIEEFAEFEVNLMFEGSIGRRVESPCELIIYLKTSRPIDLEPV